MIIFNPGHSYSINTTFKVVENEFSGFNVQLCYKESLTTNLNCIFKQKQLSKRVQLSMIKFDEIASGNEIPSMDLSLL